MSGNDEAPVERPVSDNDDETVSLVDQVFAIGSVWRWAEQNLPERQTMQDDAASLHHLACDVGLHIDACHQDWMAGGLIDAHDLGEAHIALIAPHVDWGDRAARFLSMEADEIYDLCVKPHVEEGAWPALEEDDEPDYSPGYSHGPAL